MSDLKTMRRRRTPRPAFTLVELLVVVAIIAVLAALLLPVLSRARREADSVQCLSQLRQIGTGIAAYVTDHDGTLPGPLAIKQGTGEDGTEGSLARFLEKYLVAADEPAATSADVRRSRQNVFLCPAAARVRRSGTTPTYLANMLLVPGFNQSAWGDVALRQEPLRQAALGSWNDAETDGRPLYLAEIWAIKDADQEYFREIGTPLAGLEDLPPAPAHDGHRNALFHDFHVGRVNIMRVLLKITHEP